MTIYNKKLIIISQDNSGSSIMADQSHNEIDLYIIRLKNHGPSLHEVLSDFADPDCLQFWLCVDTGLRESAIQQLRIWQVPQDKNIWFNVPKPSSPSDCYSNLGHNYIVVDARNRDETQRRVHSILAKHDIRARSQNAWVTRYGAMATSSASAASWSSGIAI